MNQAEIARALGISKTTVSRAISGKGRVREETRKEILDYIKGLDAKENTKTKNHIFLLALLPKLSLTESIAT